MMCFLTFLNQDKEKNINHKTTKTTKFGSVKVMDVIGFKKEKKGCWVG